jgi:hypothetical protein
MIEERYEQKLAEVDDLINDPDMPLCPARIWQLMEEISGHAEADADHDRRWPLPGDPARSPSVECLTAAT